MTIGIEILLPILSFLLTLGGTWTLLQYRLKKVENTVEMLNSRILSLNDDLHQKVTILSTSAITKEKDIITLLNEMKVELAEKYVTKSELSGHLVGLRNDVQQMSGWIEKDFRDIKDEFKELRRSGCALK